MDRYSRPIIHTLAYRQTDGHNTV